MKFALIASYISPREVGSSISCTPAASVSTNKETMKVAVIVLALVACVYAGSYTTKYDNIDLDQILRSERLLGNYVNCLLDAGNCTPDGKELKKSLPDALANNCKSCSEKQRNGSDKVIRFLVNERPQIWAKLAKKYDPNGQYKSRFQDVAHKAGIKV